jgi:hypothetical protein
MTGSPKPRKSRKKSGANLKKNTQTLKQDADGPGEISDADDSDDRSLSGLLKDLTGKVAGSALRVAAKAGGASLKMGKALLQKPEQLQIIREAGLSLKDLRELAGMTLNEVSDTLNLKDHSLLQAVENCKKAF